MKILKPIWYMEKLKRVRRTGWVRRGVPDSESVADHSFGATMLAALLANKKVDELKVIKMLLIHDMGESIIGDIVTDRGRKVDTKLLASKNKKEYAAIKSIFGGINKNGFVKLFNEFEENRTPEAKFARQIDKLEMVLQAYCYEKEYGIDLEEFYQTGFIKLKDKKLYRILQDLHSKRLIK